MPASAGALHGKANALHAAIETTTAEIVLVTDADCAAPPLWARATAAPFADAAVGLVCGLARLDPRPGRPFDRVQALDWTLLMGAVSALAEAGVPATGMGNNMAVRRTVYDAVGGYPALPFSVTEDFTLVRAVAERTDARVRRACRLARSDGELRCPCCRATSLSWPTRSWWASTGRPPCWPPVSA